MIADFGLSRIMPDSKLSMLTEVCGTPGVSSRPEAFRLADMLCAQYMAPEIFKRSEPLFKHSPPFAQFHYSWPRKARRYMGHGCDHLFLACRYMWPFARVCRLSNIHC